MYVPALREKEESKATDGRHTFKRKGVPSKLRLVLMENGKPRAAEKYVIELDGKLIEGTTAGDGSVEIPIPPTVKSGRLILSPGQKERIFPLNLGGLDPITELSGVQTRLRNLGFQ